MLLNSLHFELMNTIAVIHPSSELYGADRIMVQALQALPEDTRKVVYIHSDGPLIPFIYTHVPNVEVKIYPQLPIIYRSLFTPAGLAKFAGNLTRFKRFFKEESTFYNFKSVYANTLACAFMLRIFRQLHVRCFMHVHEIIEHPKMIARITAKLCARYADRVICVSQAVYDNLIAHAPDLTKNTEVIHNGIPGMAQCIKKMVSDTPERFYLFGRIMPKKGQWYLIDALRLLPEELLRGKKFVLVGDVLKGHENLKSELMQKIEESRLSPYVELHGFTSDISGLMSDADVCLIPSLMKDPFPTTVLEAMSAGKAVITTNHGGAAEAVMDGISGFLISPDAPAQFAQRLKDLIEQPQLYHIIGTEARKQFSNYFSVETFSARWMQFLHRYQFI